VFLLTRYARVQYWLEILRPSLKKSIPIINVSIILWQCVDIDSDEKWALFSKISSNLSLVLPTIKSRLLVEIYFSTVSYGRLSRSNLRSNGQLLRKLLYLQWHLSLCEMMKLKHYYITYTRAPREESTRDVMSVD